MEPVKCVSPVLCCLVTTLVAVILRPLNNIKFSGIHFVCMCRPVPVLFLLSFKTLM